MAMQCTVLITGCGRGISGAWKKTEALSAQRAGLAVARRCQRQKSAHGLSRRPDKAVRRPAPAAIMTPSRPGAPLRPGNTRPVRA
jgi:hypothetical protein